MGGPAGYRTHSRKWDPQCHNDKQCYTQSDPKGSEILDKTAKLFTAVTPNRTCSHLHPFFTHTPISWLFCQVLQKYFKNSYFWHEIKWPQMSPHSLYVNIQVAGNKVCECIWALTCFSAPWGRWWDPSLMKIKLGQIHGESFPVFKV